MNNKTKLSSKFVYWYRIHDKNIVANQIQDKDKYEEQVKKIAEFDTVSV